MLRKLKLLLWKNFILKKRQPRVIALEIIWPLTLMIIEVIIRQNNPPVDSPGTIYIPRGMPSAGLIPFLQGAVCDPTAIKEYNGTWNDTYGFYDFNPTITALLHNATLMLQDSNINISRLSHLQHDQQRLQANLGMLNSMISNSSDPQAAIQAVGMSVWTGTSNMQLNELVDNGTQLRNFLIHQLNFSAVDANSFFASSIDVNQLQAYAIEKATDDRQCLNNPLLCALKLQFDLSSTSLLSGGGNLLVDIVQEIGKGIWQLSTQQIFLSSGLLEQLACDKSEAFGKVFEFPSNKSQIEVQHRLCSLTASQSQALADELKQDLNSTKLQQGSISANTTSLYQRYQEDLNNLLEDYATMYQMGQYLEGPFRQLAENFPSNVNLDKMTSDQLGKLLVCTLCGKIGQSCVAANTKPLSTSYNRAHDELSVAGRLLEGIQLLYAPDTATVKRVILEANKTFAEIENLKEIINRFVDGQRVFLQTVDDSNPNSTYARSTFSSACEPLKSTKVSSITSRACNFIGMSDTARGVLDILNRIKIQWIGFPNETALEVYAAKESLAGSAVWAGVVFSNLADDGSLKPDVRYTIRMNETLVHGPNSLTKTYWTPGPDVDIENTLYEMFGFNYIQDIVDRGIVNVLTNKTVTEPGVYLQRFPYPCYIYDRFSTALSATMPLFMALAWIFAVSMVIRSVVQEKEDRLKETMKIMGLTSLSLWLSWFITSFIIMGSSALILTILMTCGEVLSHSNFLIVFLFMLNFTAATIMLCFVIATLFNKANLAALSGGLLYMLTYLPYIIYYNHEMDYDFSQKAGLSLLSTTAFGIACMYMARYEEQGIGLQWNNVGQSVFPDDEFSFLAANAFIFIDTILYAIVVWYIDNAFPGQYGVSRPFYFPLQKSYWEGVFCCSKMQSRRNPAVGQNGYTTVPMNTLGHNETSPECQRPSAEADPSHLPIGVSIRNLVKVYHGKQKAVDNLTLNFYEGHITSFLGHNGAGKTTTMNVLCGLLPPTLGTAYIQGMDIACDIDEIRKTLGLCPQHNILYDKLTVAEHIWFFAKLKNNGISDKELKQEVERWLDDLSLVSKRNARVSFLSGGMKRKLSVAMAYVGGSKVVLLDEPTAGVDPYARKEIWDLMIKHRENRTVVLSTHYMDEADVLGDRIAIISHGKLCCVGSSLYLKRQFSNGYYLTVAKQQLGSDSSLALTSMSDLNGLSHSVSNISDSLPTFPSSCHGSTADNDTVQSAGFSKDEELGSRGSDTSARHTCVHHRTGSEGSAAGFLQDLHKQRRSRKNMSYGCLTENVTRVVQSHIPDAQLMEDIGTELNYLLPTKPANGFQLSLLLSDLDRQKGDLGIVSYGMSDTSLEEVFLKVTNKAEEAEPDPTMEVSILNRLQRKRWRWAKKRQSSSEGRIPLVSMTDDDSDDDDGCEKESHEADCYGDAGTSTVSGNLLLFQQFKALFIKRFHNSRRYTKGFIAQIILPAFFICVALVFKLLAPTPPNRTLEMTPRIYPGHRYIPFKNFQPWQTEAAKLKLSLAQPCGVSAHYLIEGINQTICRQYLQYTDVHHRVPNKYWTFPVNVTPPVNATCCCASGKQQCPADVVAPFPPSFLTVEGLTLQDLVDKKNMTDYILKSTDDYILHRYGGVSFGNENDQYTESLPVPYQDTVQLLGVRKAAKAWYTNKGYHAAPIYLNVLNNAILRGNVNSSVNITEYGITTFNHPFNKTIGQLLEYNMRSGIDLLIALCVIFALSFVPPSFIMFLIQERATGAKHQQLVCGVNPVMYWLAHYCWDMCNYMITVVFVIIIFYAFGEDVYTSGDNFSAIVVMFILHGWAMIPLMYPATYVFKNSSTAYIVMMTSSVLIGFVTTSTTLILQLIEQTDGGEDTSSSVDNQLRIAFLIFPNYCLGRGLMDIAYNYYISAANEELKSFGTYIDVAGPFSLSVNGVGRNIIAMAVSGVFFFLVCLLIEYKFFLPSLCADKRIDPADVKKERPDEDEDVAKERRRIACGGAHESILRMKNLTKIYRSRFSSSKVLAVDRLSLEVSKGECFGLLGVNGAGKTTTFKMLTGDVPVTTGDAFVLKNSVTGSIRSVRQNIGYCPQFDAINELLTGREHLTLYARLKGVAEREIAQVVEWCLHRLALTPYASVYAGKYSGGNKRKLSAAIALIGRPSVVFLDEPTTGMDPKSKRFFWSVISDLVQQGQSVILTSHSMEECEALCTRIGIMVNGQLKCLGSSLHLKNRFGDGYMVTVRVAGSHPNLEPTKTFFNATFPGADLKEQHHNMLEYQLPSGCAPLSVVFSQLENGKDTLNIEDYSISQTTLDRVFIHFARQQCDAANVLESPARRSLCGRYRVAFSTRHQQVRLLDAGEDQQAVQRMYQDSDEFM